MKRMSKRLTADDERRIIHAYRAWEPADRSVDDLVDSLGIAKQTLYLVLGRNGEPLKSTGKRTTGAEARRAAASLPPELWDAMTDRALDFLLTQVVELREENAALRARLAHYEEPPDG